MGTTHLSSLTLKELLRVTLKNDSVLLEELASRAQKRQIPRYHGRGYANRAKTWATRVAEEVFAHCTIEQLSALSVPARDFLRAYLPDQYHYPKYTNKREALITNA